MTEPLPPLTPWSPPGVRPSGFGAEAETVDVGGLARAAARGWRTVLVGGLLGLLTALALVAWFPPRYAGIATVLLRNASDPTGSLLSRFGIAGDMAGSVGGGALGNVLKSPLETELQILGSRDVLGEAVDSLGLQARVFAPRGVPSRVLLVPSAYGTSFRRLAFDFSRQPDGSYRTAGGGATVTLRRGQPGVLPVVGRVTLAAGPLPSRFRIQFEDREDAITRLEKRLDVEKQGGEVAKLDYAGPDSITAAELPNAVIAAYLKRRRTTDRGLNHRRYEFLVAQSDTVAGQLADAENALRVQQEGSGVFDPELSGKAGVEALQSVREQYVGLESERRAIRQIVEQVERGALTPRQLAAFPSFLKAPAINSLLTQLSGLEVERTRLLERRTERDPEVAALTRSITELERQFLPIGRTYAASLDRQTGELERQEGEVDAQMRALPAQAQGNLQRQRDVRRLSQTMLALQAQIVDARLAAISEGGQVRIVDAAQPPKKIKFPRPLPTLLAALALGLVLGAVWAAVRSALSARVRTPEEAEQVTGVPAVSFTPERPLLLGPGARAGTLLLLPTGQGSEAVAVARQLAEHAHERGRSAAVVDLGAVAPGAGAALEAARRVRAIEAEHELTVVVAPALDDRRTGAVLDPSRAALLVARAGVVRRDELADGVAALVRLAVPCLGVVLQTSARPRVIGGGASTARANGTRPERPEPALAGARGDGAA